MQVHKINSEFLDNECLGSVLYANSFLFIEQQNFISVTKNVPNFLNWHTNNLHFRNMPVPI
jgi:hypothetical protein